MKIITLIVITFSFVSCSSHELSRKVASYDDKFSGTYLGRTADGAECSVDFFSSSGFKMMQWSPASDSGNSIMMTSSNIDYEEDFMLVRGGSEAQNCKARIIFDENGKLTEVRAGCGLVFSFGYDLKCRDLIKK